MPHYVMKVNVIEYGREVLVQAESRQAAAQKARAGDWITCGDPDGHVVKVTGSIQRVEPAGGAAADANTAAARREHHPKVD